MTSTPRTKVIDGVVQDNPERNRPRVDTPDEIVTSMGNLQNRGGVVQRYNVADKFGREHDALTLAKKCLEAWNDFLTDHGVHTK